MSLLNQCIACEHMLFTQRTFHISIIFLYMPTTNRTVTTHLQTQLHSVHNPNSHKNDKHLNQQIWTENIKTIGGKTDCPGVSIWVKFKNQRKIHGNIVLSRFSLKVINSGRLNHQSNVELHDNIWISISLVIKVK